MPKNAKKTAPDPFFGPQNRKIASNRAKMALIRRIFLANLALRLLCSLLMGHIHPDEHNQGPAIVANGLKSDFGPPTYVFHGNSSDYLLKCAEMRENCGEIDAKGSFFGVSDAFALPWEWGPKIGFSFGPSRSPISAFLVNAPPLWLWHRFSGLLSPQAGVFFGYFGPRFLTSFASIFVDFGIYKCLLSVGANLDEIAQVLKMFGTSIVALVFLNRTFSNTLEAIFVSFACLATCFDRKSGDFDRKSGDFDRKMVDFDRKSGDFGKETSKFDDSFSNFDETPSKNTNFLSKITNLPSKTTNFLSKSPFFGSKSSNLPPKPVNFLFRALIVGFVGGCGTFVRFTCIFHIAPLAFSLIFDAFFCENDENAPKLDEQCEILAENAPKMDEKCENAENAPKMAEKCEFLAENAPKTEQNSKKGYQNDSKSPKTRKFCEKNGKIAENRSNFGDFPSIFGEFRTNFRNFRAKKRFSGVFRVIFGGFFGAFFGAVLCISVDSLYFWPGGGEKSGSGSGSFDTGSGSLGSFDSGSGSLTVAVDAWQCLHSKLVQFGSNLGCF
eukprot:TRINITY_DN107_c0_g1_i5.p1 TRINITY_DN107_c0_g1~~TRINITY_DN107_c0_g1_i5.p1  ORF type:complete len:554 (-),score=41.53 TRINITY_DN107_c0_g1_i5:472-2133(-)